MGMNKAVKVLEIDLDTVHETFFNGLFNKKYPFSIPLKITPSMAHRILEHCNANNRPISEARVMRITQQIKNNQWIINTNTIGFNVNGNLCDGQKRLTAILRANKAITTLVTFNLPVDSFKTVDTNQARNASDLAAMAGLSDYAHVGTAINLLYRYQQGTLHRFGENPDNIMRDQLIKENLAIQDSIRAGRSVAKMMSKSVGIFCHYVLACIDREAANRFFEKLGTGAFLFPDDPIFLLRERLTRERMARTYFPAYEIVALIFKAWNACRTKKKTKTLRWSPKAGESYPRPI
jgi:hypothetical protein